MTDFRTAVEIKKPDFSISYKDKIFMTGSCFSENIGEKFQNSKFNILSNPFGILFNPSSIYRSLYQILDQKTYTADDLIFHHDLYHSFDHHGKFSNTDKDSMLKQMNTVTEVAHEFLTNANIIFITLGTAWVYVHRKTTKLAANCHKIPQSEFLRQRLSMHQIVDLHSKLITRLKEINQNIKVIYTISPVRHLKDGAVENSTSKATLLLAKDQLCSRFENVFYFPSYEIMMDELRDYRFYDEDMVHPNKTAINYIWELLSSICFTDETRIMMKKVLKIHQAFSHRPFNIHTGEFKRFCHQQFEAIREINSTHPEIDLSEYANYFTKYF